MFKCFAFQGPVTLAVWAKAADDGQFVVTVGESVQGVMALPKTDAWAESRLVLDAGGDQALALCYHGSGAAELLSIEFEG